MDTTKIIKEASAAVAALANLAAPEKREQASDLQAEIDQALAGYQDALYALREIDNKLYHVKRALEGRHDEMKKIRGEYVHGDSANFTTHP
jgi:hypothetical protein